MTNTLMRQSGRMIKKRHHEICDERGATTSVTDIWICYNPLFPLDRESVTDNQWARIIKKKLNPRIFFSLPKSTGGTKVSNPTWARRFCQCHTGRLCGLVYFGFVWLYLGAWLLPCCPASMKPCAARIANCPNCFRRVQPYFLPPPCTCSVLRVAVPPSTDPRVCFSVLCLSLTRLFKS
jgi:hypothetical protein